MSNTSILWYFEVRNSFLTIFVQNNHGVSVKSKILHIEYCIFELWYFVYGLILYGYNQSQSPYGIDFWEHTEETYILSSIW